MKRQILGLTAVVALTVGCSSNSDKTSATSGSDAKLQAALLTNMHDSLLTDITTLHAAAVTLQAAAPAPTGRGWDADLDKDAIAATTAAWIDCRTSYERTEGAIAPLFPDIDAEIDARYDDFLADATISAAGGDQDLFDDQGVTGMHAIERILYTKTTPPTVVAVEATLPGYKASAWPATEAEATEFKTKLLARLVTDTETLKDDWTPQVMDLDGSYLGLVALMNEQREKVNKAASQEEESRYSRRTMKDIRDNLAGTQTIYALFQPWLASKSGGDAIDTKVQSGFTTLGADYGTVTGDSIPEPPSTWSSETPSAADLQTPFGRLFTSVHEAVDPNVAGSVVDEMNKAAVALSLTPFTDE